MCNTEWLPGVLKHRARISQLYSRLNPANQNIAVNEVWRSGHLETALIKALTGECHCRQFGKVVRTLCDGVQHGMKFFNR